MKTEVNFQLDHQLIYVMSNNQRSCRYNTYHVSFFNVSKRFDKQTAIDDCGCSLFFKKKLPLSAIIATNH